MVDIKGKLRFTATKRIFRLHQAKWKVEKDMTSARAKVEIQDNEAERGQSRSCCVVCGETLENDSIFFIDKASPERPLLVLSQIRNPLQWGSIG